jgi:hypothetical protein
MDEKLLSEFCRQLSGYFGDGKSSDSLALLRKDIAAYSETGRIFREGLDAILADPAFECLPFVQDCANRHVNDSEEQARAWLVELRRELFGGGS